MKALTFQGVRSLRFEDVPDPTIENDGDAIVGVDIAAICGSDLHPYHGREPGLDVGTVMGHEFAGRVVATGRAVRSLHVGDRVVSPFTTSCGRCFYCSEGLTSRCVSGQLFGWREGGLGLHGGQASLVRVPFADTTLFAVPEDLPLELALLLGDTLATGYHCAKMAGVSRKGVYAVIGCGPVGLMAVLSAGELGADKVFALDNVAERLARAAELGANAIDVAAQDSRLWIREATQGRGVDGVLEAVGSPEAGALAFDLVRPGGTISVVGVHHESVFPFSPAQAYDKNLTFRIGRCPARGLMEALMPLARRRGADISGILTHRVPLSSGVEAYDLFDRKRNGCIKVALTEKIPGSML